MVNTEVIECYGSLKNYEKQLERLNFVRCHKSYLVNCRYIRSMSGKEVKLDNGVLIPLSKYKKDAVKEQYQTYLRTLP